MRFFAGEAARRGAWCLGFLAAVLSAGPAGAGTVDVHVAPNTQTVNVADVFSVTITADISEPLLGFGFELTFDDQLFELNSTKVAPELTAAGKTGGDFISALSFPEPMSGDDVLLASASFTALGEGIGDFSISVAEGNLAQGFAEVAIGFMSDYDVMLGQVTVLPALDSIAPPTPEPATLSLLVAGGLVAMRRRRL